MIPRDQLSFVVHTVWYLFYCVAGFGSIIYSSDTPGVENENRPCRVDDKERHQIHLGGSWLTILFDQISPSIDFGTSRIRRVINRSTVVAAGLTNHTRMQPKLTE